MKQGPLTVLEFYSGIGGMHYALHHTNIPYRILKAFDINTFANTVYEHNFGTGIVVQRNIEALPLEYFDRLKANLWTMSPPCQPYTRIGLAKGSKDTRAKSFLKLMDVLPQMQFPPEYLLVENVKGFEESDSRDLLIETLSRCGYAFQEFLLSPIQFGIPNSRLRYYLLAVRTPRKFSNPPTNTIISYIPGTKCIVENKSQEQNDNSLEEYVISETSNQLPTLREYLGLQVNLEKGEEYRVPDKILQKYGLLFDIVKPSSKRSCCFTKGYHRLVEATGSILQMEENLDTYQYAVEGKMDVLRLRYFTPEEIALLMGFPIRTDQAANHLINHTDIYFSFPPSISLRQQYRLLGNSVNTYVVSQLLRYLLSSSE
ncbi:uncharacterized protein VTP21DRAFT_10450 [Calcarisporiella thermophila]|uniref:uncharacterized protein n=1 Tax=Calcarisporiella thermophila TaxID=911321 RepID=UPI003741F5AA